MFGFSGVTKNGNSKDVSSDSGTSDATTRDTTSKKKYKKERSVVNAVWSNKDIVELEKINIDREFLMLVAGALGTDRRVIAEVVSESPAVIRYTYGPNLLFHRGRALDTIRRMLQKRYDEDDDLHWLLVENALTMRSYAGLVATYMQTDLNNLTPLFNRTGNTFAHSQQAIRDTYLRALISLHTRFGASAIVPLLLQRYERYL